MRMIFRVPAVCVNCVDCAAEFSREHGGAPASLGVLQSTGAKETAQAPKAIALWTELQSFFASAADESPWRPWRSSTQSSAPKIEDGRVLRSSGSKNEDRGGSSKNPPPSSKDSPSSKDPPSSKNPLIFDFPVPKIEDLRHLRFSEPKIEEPHLQSSILWPEDRRTAHHLRCSASKNGSKIGQKTYGRCTTSSNKGGGSSKMMGVLRSSGSEERRTPHLPPSRPEERRSPHHLSFSRSEERSKNPSPGTPSSDPHPPTNRRQVSWGSIFRQMFGLEDRSEDRDWIFNMINDPLHLVPQKLSMPDTV